MPLNDPFGRARLPGDFSRAGRIKLLKEAAEDLLAGRLPREEARLFLGSALESWLQAGGGIGELERKYLRVTPVRGSRLTAAEILKREEPHRDESGDSAGERRFSEEPLTENLDP